MDTNLVISNGDSYLECVPTERWIQREADALDLIAACIENDTSQLMLHAGCLSEDFYRLRTGLAGAVLQKFTDYHIRVAAVIPSEIASQGHFSEMVSEANRGNSFHVFQTREAAERWLIRKE